jgi:transposase
MRRESRKVWAKRVERWRDSGLTAREFASEIGVNASRLEQWKWQLAREERQRGIKGSRRPQENVPATVRTEGVEFVEVVDSGPAAVTGALEVVLASGGTVRVPPKFDEDALRRLLAVLGVP